MDIFQTETKRSVGSSVPIIVYASLDWKYFEFSTQWKQNHWDLLSRKFDSLWHYCHHCGWFKVLVLGIFPHNFDFGGLEETWASRFLHPTPVTLMHVHIWGGQLQEVSRGLPSASGPLSCLSLAWVPPCFRTWAAQRCGTSCTIWATSVCPEASCLYSHSLIPAQTLFPGRLIYTSAYCHFNCFSFKTRSSWWAFPPCNPLNILSGVSCQGCSLPPSPGPASRACDLYSHARPHTQKVSLWFNVLLPLPWNS